MEKLQFRMLPPMEGGCVLKNNNSKTGRERWTPSTTWRVNVQNLAPDQIRRSRKKLFKRRKKRTSLHQVWVTEKMVSSVKILESRVKTGLRDSQGDELSYQLRTFSLK